MEKRRTEIAETDPSRELRRLLRAHPNATLRAIAPPQDPRRPLYLSDVHYESDVRAIVQVLA